jgi:hypothetical protein
VLCQKRLEQNVNERHRVRSGTFLGIEFFIEICAIFLSIATNHKEPLDGGTILRKVLMGRFAYYLVI